MTGYLKRGNLLTVFARVFILDKFYVILQLPWLEEICIARVVTVYHISSFQVQLQYTTQEYKITLSLSLW